MVVGGFVGFKLFLVVLWWFLGGSGDFVGAWGTCIIVGARCGLGGFGG